MGRSLAIALPAPTLFACYNLPPSEKTCYNETTLLYGICKNVGATLAVALLRSPYTTYQLNFERALAQD